MMFSGTRRAKIVKHNSPENTTRYSKQETLSASVCQRKEWTLFLVLQCGWHIWVLKATGDSNSGIKWCEKQLIHNCFVNWICICVETIIIRRNLISITKGRPFS
ncbi:unnamed protein product [Lactuca virosa]|uniref:Uncharacterized protein n=1 Tax=Lactuca virosa TaxID=75947 RepID=A0AAU9LDJ2_9ASTR|nr:unnamed protein product [Lactuca virosa]